MMKQEFEQRIGAEVTQEQYRMIEHVYMWHPSIPNVGGKDVIAQLWKIGGMALIEDMDSRAKLIEGDYERLVKTVSAIDRRIAELDERLDMYMETVNRMEEEKRALKKTCQTHKEKMKTMVCGK